MKLLIVAVFLFVKGAHARSCISHRIDEIIKQEALENGFQGNVLVSDCNRVVFSKSYGLADIEFGVKNSRNTKFRIGSLSKQFTATALLTLYASGKIKSLDDFIGNYVVVP